MSRFDLENRLVAFAGEIVLMTKEIKGEPVRIYLSDQIIRSSCSAALNYGEVQGTVSKRDYIFKASLVLKELKETRVALKVIKYILKDSSFISKGLQSECEELIAIVATLIKRR